jgi:aminopeptidase
MPVEEALQKLWQEIFRVSRLEKSDIIAEWQQHDELLRARAASLSSLGIARLHFSGPGTDLTVGLSEAAVFRGGSDVSPRGVRFQPNIPTEEVFTTPDWRQTQGEVAATRPFLVNGKLITDLRMVFKNGELSEYTVSDGADVFGEYIQSDSGARRLGEVALVGADSPVFKSGIVYQEILLDENAACHIAIGSAYKFCINDADRFAADDFDRVGCNESSVHTDIMISSEHVTVAAQLFDGREMILIENGLWKSF